jgi:hypothetical protein
MVERGEVQLTGCWETDTGAQRVLLASTGRAKTIERFRFTGYAVLKAFGVVFCG